MDPQQALKHLESATGELQLARSQHILLLQCVNTLKDVIAEWKELKEQKAAEAKKNGEGMTPPAPYPLASAIERNFEEKVR